MINKIYKSALLWLMSTKIYSWLLLKIIPFIRITTYYASIRGWKYKRGYAQLQPGDILLCIDRKKLTTFLVPGEFTHACLCVDVGSEWEISEMTHSGYTKSTFFDVCKESDRVVILRCSGFDAEYLPFVLQRCRQFDGAEYDVEFKFGIKALYCSELVYLSDFEKRLGASEEDLAHLGRPYISPTGLYEAKNVAVVWDSDQEIPPPGMLP